MKLSPNIIIAGVVAAALAAALLAAGAEEKRAAVPDLSGLWEGPGFDLAPAEAKHPSWARSYATAKRRAKSQHRGARGK